MYPSIPTQYKVFVNERGLFEGFTSGRPGYIRLWALENIMEFNADLSVDELAPGYIAFAGNGAGEVAAFDGTGAVFMLPMIGMEAQYADPIASSFSELAGRFKYSRRPSVVMRVWRQFKFLFHPLRK
ncbi:SMI1/KNR4 family protein [Adhaeretor mobilis]|uniref:SMI1/KNR4 family protein n=1 Tax=Adhaeretor mobilis TaxID=1930276 RepID=UPI0011A97BD9|nr:SMI1/KNR4 family protein [Adhaeretor mobilis]